MNTPANRIKAALQALGKSQAWLAGRLKISKAAVNQWVLGNTKSLKQDHLIQASKELGVSPEWIVTGEGVIPNWALPTPAMGGRMLTGGVSSSFSDAKIPENPPQANLELFTPPPGSRVVTWETPEDLPDGGSGYVFVPLYNIHLSAGGGLEWDEDLEHKPIAFRSEFFHEKRLHQKTSRAAFVRGDSMTPFLNDGDIVLINEKEKTVSDGRIYVISYCGELFVKRIYRVMGGSMEIRSDNSAYKTVEVRGEDLNALQIIGRVVWKGGNV